MSNKTLEELQTADEYKSFVDEAVDTLKAYMTRHAPKLHVSFVTFKPLSPEHVTQYLQEMQSSNEVEIAELVAANMRSDVAKPTGPEDVTQSQQEDQTDVQTNESDVAPQNFELRLLDLQDQAQSLREMQSRMEAETKVLIDSMREMIPEDCEARILNVKNEAFNLQERKARLEAEIEVLVSAASREHELQRLRNQQTRMETENAALIAANTRHGFVPRGFHIY